MEVAIIKLGLVDQVRLYASTVNSADFIGMISPLIQDNVEDGGLFIIHGDSKNRTFRYFIKDGRGFITDDSGVPIELNKGRSLTGVIMDKLSNNQFSRAYGELKDNYANLLKGLD